MVPGVCCSQARMCVVSCNVGAPTAPQTQHGQAPGRPIATWRQQLCLRGSHHDQAQHLAAALLVGRHAVLHARPALAAGDMVLPHPGLAAADQHAHSLCNVRAGRAGWHRAAAAAAGHPGCWRHGGGAGGMLATGPCSVARHTACRRRQVGVRAAVATVAGPPRNPSRQQVGAGTANSRREHAAPAWPPAPHPPLIVESRECAASRPLAGMGELTAVPCLSRRWRLDSSWLQGKSAGACGACQVAGRCPALLACWR